MPEFTAPGLGRQNNHVAIDAEFGANASGVLYALGGASGGLALYMDKGQIVYEYNMMIIERYSARSSTEDRARQAPNRGRYDVRESQARSPRPGRDQGGRQGSGEDHRRADRAGRVYRRARVSMSAGSRVAGVARLLRSRTVQVQRKDSFSQRGSDVGRTNPTAPGRSRGHPDRSPPRHGTAPPAASSMQGLNQGSVESRRINHQDLRA